MGSTCLGGKWFCLGMGEEDSLQVSALSSLAHGFLRVTLSLIPPSSLKKMTVGMFLASMAFVAAAIVQVEIDVSCLLILQWPFLVRRGGGVAHPPPGLKL